MAATDATHGYAATKDQLLKRLRRADRREDRRG
jgi:hypothetical protein